MRVCVDTSLVLGLDRAADIRNYFIKLLKVPQHLLPIFLSHWLIMLLHKTQVMHLIFNLILNQLILLNPDIWHRPKELLHHRVLQVKILCNHSRDLFTELSLEFSQKLVSDLEVPLVKEFYHVRLGDGIVELEVDGLVALVKHLEHFLGKEQL